MEFEQTEQQLTGLDIKNFEESSKIILPEDFKNHYLLHIHMADIHHMNM
ncbi:hypothetical protein [Chryseobacterium sp.]|nr:hypothetical protein [Chryseobacterium sp.]MBV8327741.1 hypothetical protein [Chryseobacterium sp.]